MNKTKQRQPCELQNPEFTATYTPGYSTNSTEFMPRRTIESRGEFFLP